LCLDAVHPGRVESADQQDIQNSIARIRELQLHGDAPAAPPGERIL